MKLIALALTLLFTVLSATFALANPAYKDTGYNVDSLNDEAAANVGRRDLPELQRRNKNENCNNFCKDHAKQYGPKLRGLCHSRGILGIDCDHGDIIKICLVICPLVGIDVIVG
jgi:hypothetical protein